MVVSRMRGLGAERLRLLRLVLVAERVPLALFTLVGVLSVGAPVVTSLLTGVLAQQLQASGDVGLAIGAGVGIAVSIVVLQQAMAFRASAHRTGEVIGGWAHPPARAAPGQRGAALRGGRERRLPDRHLTGL